MKELSLNILDITENSVKARATLTSILLTETADTLEIKIIDNGCGMSEEVVAQVTNPFYTTRTTRSVGMGIPLFKFAAEQTGGELVIKSKHIDEYPEEHGTSISASFYKNHIDFTPLGDITSSVVTLIQGNPDIDFRFLHTTDSGEVSLDTRELREVLEEVPLDSFEVLSWIDENLREQYKSV